MTTVIITTATFHLDLTPEEKSAVQVAKLYPSSFRIRTDVNDGDEEEETLTPEQLANLVVRELPNLTKLVFRGSMARYGNNLSLLLKAFLMSGDESLLSSSGDESLLSSSRHTINSFDFQSLEIFINETTDEAKREVLDIIEQCNKNSIKALKLPSGLFSVDSKVSSLKGCHWSAQIIQNNKESLELLSVGLINYDYCDPDDLPGPGDGATSSLVEAIRNNNTLTCLELECFHVGSDMQEALVDLLKNNNYTTLQHFDCFDLYRHEQDEIISYYLALNNLGRKDWGKSHHPANHSTKINALSSIPKPENFLKYGRTYEVSNEKSTPARYFSCLAYGLSKEKKELWYTSFIYDFLHYNLDLFVGN